MGVHIPHGKGQIFWGEWASHCEVWGHSAVVYAKTAEPIGMPFGLWARMGHRNHLLDGGPVCHVNQFWDAICCNWFWRLMGHNFGCMIASDTQFDSRGGFSGSSYPMKT